MLHLNSELSLSSPSLSHGAPFTYLNRWAIFEAGKSALLLFSTPVVLIVDVLGKLELISEFVYTCLLAFTGASARICVSLKENKNARCIGPCLSFARSWLSGCDLLCLLPSDEASQTIQGWPRFRPGYQNGVQSWISSVHYVSCSSSGQLSLCHIDFCVILFQHIYIGAFYFSQVTNHTCSRLA